MKVTQQVKYHVLVLLLCFCSMALYAQNQTVNINVKNATLRQVFALIEKQTTYRFSYPSAAIDDRHDISIQQSKATVAAVLNKALTNRNLSYRIISDKSIAISEKHARTAEVVQSTNQGGRKHVSGVITDNNGEPVIGASIVEKGTKNATVTDIDGKYSITVADGAVLQVTYVGFVAQELRTGKGGSLNVQMEEDLKGLDEVVVVGYGSSTRRDLIASVSTVKTDQLANIPTANLAQGLAGRSPGMIIKANGGGVNAMPNISIRGGGTPLYVIDGVVRSEQDFANLSSDDIESMSILKDASATAVYGSRATNGIVQVTTKQGKQGKALVEYDFNYSLAQPSTWPEPMNSYERAEYANIARKNDGLNEVYSAEAIQSMRDGSQPQTYNNTNWRKLVLNDWAPQTKHAVRLTGGSENHHYYASLGHINQNSLYKHDNHYMKRTNFRLAESSLIKSINLEVNAALDGYVQINTHPYSSTASGYYHIFSHINDKSPLSPGVNLYGLPYNLNDNPVAETAPDNGYNRTKLNVINGKGELVWHMPWVDGLKVRVASNYRYYSSTNKQWRKDSPKYDWDSKEPLVGNKPLLYHNSATGYAFTNQAFVEYAHGFGLHRVSGLAGFEQYYEKGENYWAQRENYEFNIDQMSVGSANTMKNDGSESELGRAAWIAQAKYNYANKYYAEASLRYDGSDYFAPGKRWGAFFSGSLGWVVTEEKFMQPLVEKNILNSLKLRASYGETGLDSSAGRFAYLTAYTLNPQSYVVNGEYAAGFTEGNLASPDLTWYTTKQTDFGFDFASLNNRLYGQFDYFYYSTKGYLVSPSGQSYLNTALGVAMPKVKSRSEFRRAGFEVQLGWRSNIGALKYDISANYTFFDQLWALDESEAETSYMNPYIRSQQQKGYYGTMLHNLGYYTSADDVYNSVGIVSSYNSGYMTAGDIKYHDANGDGRITNDDMRRLGKNSYPRGQFGVNINLSYKGFSLGALFQGSTSFDMYISGSAAMQTGQAGSLPVIYDYQTDYWTPSNTGGQYPRLMSNTGLNANNNYQTSDFWLVNGAYLRMKDFQLAYDLKYSLLKRITWLSKIRVGISGQNIFTISKSTKYGLDPENSSTVGYGYPVERTIAFTLNLGF
uniref:TonB-dependent receptor n=4 Tax=unclassified Prevotella TaxID=2638335 RepID=A0AB33JPJ4_9BACT